MPVSETYVLNGLQPNTLYYIWLAAKSKRGEGATTPPIPVRTDQYGKSTLESHRLVNPVRFSLIWNKRYRNVPTMSVPTAR